MVRCMLSHAHLSTTFWGEAISTAIYILNRVHSRTIGMTPYEIWRGTKPSLSHLKVWGSSAHVKILGPNRGKLDPKSIKCTFIGYCENFIGYRFIIHHSDGSVRVIESRDAFFFEDDLDKIEKIVELFEITKKNKNKQPQEQIIKEPPPKDILTRIQRERHPPSYLLKYYYAFNSEEIPNDPIDFNDAANSIDHLNGEKQLKNKYNL